MVDFSVTQHSPYMNNNLSAFKDFRPLVRDDLYYSTLIQKSNNVSLNDIKNKKRFNKLAIGTITTLATLLLGYITILRRLESKFFKDIAKSIKPEEIHLPELKKIAKEVNLTSNKGNKINLWDINPSNSNKYIINVHGIDAGKTAQELILKRAEEHQYGFIEFDYCGQGNSTGKFNQAGCVESLETVVDYLKNKGVKNDNIVLLGHSMGTGVVCDYARKNNVRGLILIEPFDKFLSTIKSNILNVNSLPKIIKSIIQKLPSWMIPIKNKFNNINALKEIRQPTLIITAKDDAVVSNNLTKNLYEKTKKFGDKEFIEFEQGGHLLTEDKEKASFKFIDKLFNL